MDNSSKYSINQSATPSIILPLNEYFYNHEKYDGLDRGEDFQKKHPHLIKFVQKIGDLKYGNTILVIFLAIPIFIFAVAFYFGPIYCYRLISFRSHIKASEKLHTLMDKIDEHQNTYFKKRFNVKEALIKYEKFHITFFVYYNNSMIPRDEMKRISFFQKLDQMQKDLNVKFVFEANTKVDIENVISKFGITVSESLFISDGIIDLTGYKHLGERNIFSNN